MCISHLLDTTAKTASDLEHGEVLQLMQGSEEARHTHSLSKVERSREAWRVRYPCAIQVCCLNTAASLNYDAVLHHSVLHGHLAKQPGVTAAH